MTTPVRPFPHARWLCCLALAAGCGPCQSSPCPTPSEAQLCQWLWAGGERADGAAFVSTFTAATGAGCPAPTPAQAGLYAQRRNFGEQLFALDAGPSDCDLPDSGDSQQAAQIAAWLADGHLKWSCEEAEACAGVATTGTIESDTQLLDDGGCAQILSGALSAGSACSSDWECQPGLFCRASASAGCGNGNCAALVAIGAPCGDQDQCVGQGSCNNGVCVAPSSEPLGGEGASCADAGCQGCLLCVAGRCQAVAAGAACAADSDCPGPLLYCENGACRPSHTFGDDGGCVPGDEAACLEGWCAPGPDGGAGTCVPASALGGPCLTYDDCATSRANCVVPTGQTLGSCAAGFAAGQPCPDDSTCAAGLFCDPQSGNCATQKANGASCQSADECQSGNCSQGSCGSPCPSNPGSCQSLGSVSQVLALGGALVLGQRRRRRRGTR